MNALLQSILLDTGSTLAFASPVGDVQIEQFSALQGVQAEPLSNSETEQIKGASKASDLLKKLAKLVKERRPRTMSDFKWIVLSGSALITPYVLITGVSYKEAALRIYDAAANLIPGGFSFRFKW